MSKVNFVAEFNAFMRFARDNNLSMRERMLWIALFHIANDRAIMNTQTRDYDWPDDFIQVSNGELNLFSCLDKRGVETLRNSLRQKGLIDFQPGQKNRKNPSYRLLYLTARGENAPNTAPNSVPNTVPNTVPNYAPNPVPNSVPKTPFLGAEMYPTMSPYPKGNIKQSKGEVNQSGFLDLSHPVKVEGFLPLEDEK